MGRYPGATKFVTRAGKESRTLENSNKSAAKAQPVMRTRELTDLARLAAESAYNNAIAAGQSAADAQLAADDAYDKALLGELAYGGEFISTGVIPNQFQDHGVGDNIFNYRDVYLGWRPYGWFTWSPLDTVDPFAYTDNFDVAYDATLETDVMQVFSELDAYNTMGFRHITMGSKYQDNTRHVASIHVRTHTGRPCDIQLRVEEYADLTGVGDGSPVLLGQSSQVFNLSGNSRYRLSFPFTTGVGQYIVLRVRGKRLAGIAGKLAMCSLYNWMLEEVTLGQEQPSKFTMPYFNRGELSSNAIEGQALQGFVSGCGLSRVASNQVNVDEGSAYVPAVDKIVFAPAESLTPTLTTAGVRYVYLASNIDGTQGNYISSTTAPDNPYFGDAKCFPGNTFQRYIGSYVIYGGEIPRFREHNGYYTFQDPIASRLVSTAAGTTPTDVSCAAFVPAFCRLVELQALMDYVDANSTLYVGPGGVAISGGNAPLTVGVGTNGRGPNRSRGPIQLNANLEFRRQTSAAGQVASVAILGFWYDR